MSRHPFGKQEEKAEKSLLEERLVIPKSQEPPKEIEEPVPQTDDRNVSIVLSEENAYIHDVLKSQPKRLKDIDIQSVPSDDPNRHRLSLPDEFEPYYRKFTFRWLYKKRQAIADAVQNKGWLLVNHTYFPDLPNHLFTTNGVMERGDNILAFIPKKAAEEMREKAYEDSRNMVASRIDAHKGNPNFYTPTDHSEEGKDTRVVGL